MSLSAIRKRLDHVAKEWHGRGEEYRREILRLYGLPDRWLGEELAKLLLRAEAENPDLDHYDLQPIAVMARRLGATAIRESLLDPSLDGLSPEEFRKEAMGMAPLPRPNMWDIDETVEPTEGQPLSAVAILFANPLHGNPVNFAFDRICPPLEDDELGKDMRRLTGIYCDRSVEAWVPDLKLLAEADVDPDAEDAFLEEEDDAHLKEIFGERPEFNEMKMDPEELAKTREEVVRIYGLSDRWLGEELMRLCRLLTYPQSDGSMSIIPGLFYNPMVMEVIPELARRLGAKLHPDEHRKSRLRELSPEQLRVDVGDAFARRAFIMWSDKPSDEEHLAYDLLNRDHLHGNPIIIALDRLCPLPPAGQEWYDWLAWDARVRSAVYFTEAFDSWTPECQARPLESISIEEERSIIEAAIARNRVVYLIRGASAGIPIGPRAPLPEMNAKGLPNGEYRKKSQAARSEVERLFHLSDLDLAKELMRLSEQCYRENFHLYDKLSGRRSLVVHTVPEVARRLALKAARGGPQAEEAIEYAATFVTLPHLAEEGDLAFRKRTGEALLNNRLAEEYYRDPRFMVDPTCASGLLSREFHEGNPIAFAVDRICPPAQEGGDKRDPLACHARLVGSLSTKKPFSQWTPDVEVRSFSEREEDGWWEASEKGFMAFMDYCDFDRTDPIATGS